MEDINERIKELRKQNKLTQDRAAQKFLMDKSTWSRIENGYREPSVQLIKKICLEWNTSADYLLFGEKNTENQVDINGLTYYQIHLIKEVIDAIRHS